MPSRTSKTSYLSLIVFKLNSIELKPVKTPICEVYHPEIGDIPLCTDEDSAKYRSMISCCIWIIMLGRFDNAYDTSTVSRFSMTSREGRLKAVKRVFLSLKIFSRG
jgi:hypothetical protein